MPILIDTKGAKVDLPWIAVHVLLRAYYDRRGSMNDTLRADDGVQWTVVKGPENVVLNKEVDMYLVTRAKGERDQVELGIYHATIRKRNLESSLEVAREAKNQPVIDQFEKELQEVRDQEANLVKTLAEIKVPDTSPVPFEFPPCVDDLKFGLPDYGPVEPAKEVKKGGK